MKLLLAVLPTVLLTGYSQLITKWRVAELASTSVGSVTTSGRLIGYLQDPYIISAYVFSLLSSVAWLFVAERYPVSTAFPTYIGAMFVLVTFCSALWLKESITPLQVAGLLLIVAGVALVSRAT